MGVLWIGTSCGPTCRHRHFGEIPSWRWRQLVHPKHSTQRHKLQGNYKLVSCPRNNHQSLFNRTKHYTELHFFPLAEDRFDSQNMSLVLWLRKCVHAKSAVGTGIKGRPLPPVRSKGSITVQSLQRTCKITIELLRHHQNKTCSYELV